MHTASATLTAVFQSLMPLLLLGKEEEEESCALVAMILQRKKHIS
jgi:hypothetical protein